MAGAADVEKVFDAPGLGGMAIEGSHLGGTRAAVDDFVIGHHHDFVRGGEAVDADGVEFALGAAHHAVMHHDEVGVGLHHIAGAYRLHRARAREDFFDCG